MSDRFRVAVDGSAIRRNVELVQRSVAAAGGAEICAVVKADAYGHGIDIVVPELMRAGIQTLGIASNAEARAVRRLGFSGRLLRVRAATPREALSGTALRIEEWVGGLAHARAIAEVARSESLTLDIHLATNGPGISRESVDLSSDAGRAELRAILMLDGLSVRGVCAHFPCESVGQTRAGLEAFLSDVAFVFRELGPDRAIDVQRHCATSFAALTLPESHLDLVRIGAAVYGDTSAPVPGQSPAMRVTSEVASVSRYPAGATVGYDRTVVLERDAVIATVPLGYGDGIPRLLSGTGRVLIRGRAAQMIDLVAMCSFSIDVTEVPGVQPGDEVVILGAQGAHQRTMDELAAESGVIAAATYAAWGGTLASGRVALGGPAHHAG
ncbi:alanine racemase [Leucobacter sp. Psy1]|uniref:alanine racemase n=1 Tax=Leucobacter sp. Psy1 TaxID=2875729 RepID=UPI001CD4C895|nr:alanine racemase [Leucobacter sp. Psy1]UBH05526.1 alanine racemase [Leucobacter sp. Psy1]